MHAADSPHILVVDDDERLRQLLTRFLGEQGLWVTAACDAADARQKLGYFLYDAAIIDVMMPGESGVELTRAIKQEQTLPVLMLTAMSEVEDRVAGLEAGADDYLPKPFEPRELLLRLRNVMKRAAPPAPAASTLAHFGDYAFDTDRLTLTRQGEPVALTMSEAMLLKELLRRPGETVSRTELARSTGGEAGNERSVDVLVTRLRRKVEPDPARPVHILTVRGEGYMLKG
jgi:two-component system phosphate regulon response regulator OmpR